MFCPNCGENVKDNEKYCSNCGADINAIKKTLNGSIMKQNNNTTSKSDVTNPQNIDILDKKKSNESRKNNTMTEDLSNKSKEFVSKHASNIKKFFSKFKKQLIYGTCAILVLIIAFVAYSNIFGFEKLSWDDSYYDTSNPYVTQTDLNLKVNFSNLEKVNEIKYTSSLGEITSDGDKFTIDLNNEKGKCVVTAQYKHKKISKEFTVIPYFSNENDSKDLYLDFKIDEDSDEDLDFDGLTNKEEKEYKTNPQVYDTDMDGLDDNYEIFTSKTDPNNKDSDMDGLSDYDEIKLDLNPNLSDSKGDGILDGKRTLSYDYNSDKVKIKITGSGNVASTVAEVISDTKISKKEGLIDNLYTFYTDATIKEANITIQYLDSDLEKYGLAEDKLYLYYFNPETSDYEKVDAVVDAENNVIKANLSHFSNYVIGDSTKFKGKTTSEVLFVLDNSWSMYTDEQYTKYTGDINTGDAFDGFDKEGLRFTITKDIANKLIDKNYKIGISEFRADYKNVLEIGSSKNEIDSRLDKMMGSFVTNKAGTNITNALYNGIKEFDKNSDSTKCIVLLTDGFDLELKKNTTSIIENAIENNVKIYSVGFGGGSYNTELANISNGTGGMFYSSSNAQGLKELFENIGAELNDSLVDIDGDLKSDGILVADSGFVVNRDGFSFKNYGSNLSNDGHCYGMATFAEMYYKKVLPLKYGEKYLGDLKSYAFDFKGTYFENYPNLYDYKLKTNELKYSAWFGFDYFNEKLPANIYKINGTTLSYNDKYKDDINKSGVYDISVVKSGLDKSAQLEKHGVNYEDYEETLINEDKMQKSSVVDNDDLQLFNAIYCLYIKQSSVEKVYSSGFKFLYWAREAFGYDQNEVLGADGFINILKSRLNDKDAVAISGIIGGGGHVINAISLVRDVETPNHYYIGVYDNNYPGEKRYLEVECRDGICVIKENNYYNDSGEVLRITPSLQYDLEYFN